MASEMHFSAGLQKKKNNNNMGFFENFIYNI